MAIGDTLDITEFKQRDEALVEAIIDAVRGTQMFVICPYPNKLLITPEQFEMLKPDPEAVPFDDLLYQTKYNIMDVRVKGVYEPRDNFDRSVLS